MTQPTVFVSHSHADRTFAVQLVGDLRAAGASVWLDEYDVGAGDFQERISAALANCQWFVLVLTKSALASEWVRQEVHAANSLKHTGQIRNLIFIKAEPIEFTIMPPLWRVFNVFDATSKYNTALDQVLRVIGLPSTQVRARAEFEKKLARLESLPHYRANLHGQLTEGNCPYCHQSDCVIIEGPFNQFYCHNCGMSWS